jgi:hypothetical protein
VREIALSRGLVALVDDEDYHRVMAVDSKWHAKRHRQTDYAKRNLWINGKRTTRTLHQMVMRAKPGELVDHINGNGLDNRKCNLRIVTGIQNRRNQTHKVPGCSSRFKGVNWNKGKWRATIGWTDVNGKHRKELGRFTTEEAAQEAYAAAAKLLHGEYAAPYVQAAE